MSGPLVQRSYGRGAGASDAYDALREFDARPARTATRVVAKNDAALPAAHVPLASAEHFEPASYVGGQHQQQMQRQIPQRHTGAVMEPCCAASLNNPS